MGEFGILQWIVLGLVGWAFVAAMRGLGGGGGEVRFCTACGSQGVPQRVTRGSFGIEVVLWLCLIVPGLIYSLWRLSTRRIACSSCGSATLVPPDSPVAQKMRRDLGQSPPVAKG